MNIQLETESRTGVQEDNNWFDGREYQGETKIMDVPALGQKMTVQHGRGKQTWVDGSTYDGEWFEGQQHGHGIGFVIGND